MTDLDLSYHEIEGRRLACRIRSGKAPTLLFLPGYASDMDGGKATAIDAFAAEQGLGCIRFDYSGTGLSDGDFAEGTLARWLDEMLSLIDRSEGPLILIGSSMGGWLALHGAIRRLDRVQAVLGIAAAPDFTEWGFTADQKAAIEKDGKWEEASPYDGEPFVTHRGFWQSGQDLRLLEEPIGYRGPVRFVHGDRDEDVPVSVALRAMRQLTSEDVQLKLIKGGGHRLSEPRQIAAILTELHELVNR
ncbi:alpha/beta fold hydrolase [Sphingomicrobium lutaoense]|uniref:Palmitoyl-protein thioesterase ABHD10, mitochondrial n=1 Tax=Sphingomicrobium lutaoense TaxID=515949 RepID=A0A839Z475_9SPHN|nr:alpha/beta hydrolase [Sphingomicrobium lutaoense]MBB3764643.1 pimeloyl-ACP methyl ester carboxylesterase [Sphingomicrobium lutaoense]